MSVEPSVSDAVAVEMEASQDGGEGSPAGGAPAAEGKVKIQKGAAKHFFVVCVPHL